MKDPSTATSSVEYLVITNSFFGAGIDSGQAGITSIVGGAGAS